MQANSQRSTPNKRKLQKTLIVFSLKSHDILYRNSVYLYLGFCHKWIKCGDFYSHPHSSTTMSSNVFSKTSPFSKTRADIDASLVGTQHASSSISMPFFFFSKVTSAERLGNFFRCVEEHLPLH